MPRLNCVTWNIGSIRKHWMRVEALAQREKFDIVALQEVRADATTQKEMAAILAERGWQIFWGGTAPPHSGARQRGQDFPGVAMMVRRHFTAVQLDHSDELVKWQEQGRLMALQVENVIFYNLYAHSSHKGGVHTRLRNTLYEDLFVSVACHEKAPVVTMGDWNHPVHDTPFAFHAVLAGGCALAGCDDFSETYVPTFVSGDSSSVIDGFVANHTAAKLCTQSGTVLSEALQHRPVWLTLTATVHVPAKTVLRPRFCVGDAIVEDSVSARLWQQFSPAFLQACDRKDVEMAWSVWSQCFETILLESSANAGQSVTNPLTATTARRGHLAETKLAPEFPESCNPKKMQLHHAQRRLYKVQCQLRQLVKAHLPSEHAQRTALKVVQSVVALIPEIHCPAPPELASDSDVAAALLSLVEQHCDRKTAQDRMDRLQCWKQRMKNDWISQPTKVWQWLRGEQAEQVHAVFDNGVLCRGANAIFTALRKFWVPVYSLDPALVAQATKVNPDYLSSPAVPRTSSQFDPQQVIAFNAKLKSTSAAGPDGWQAADWKRMDLRTAGYLCMFWDLCADIEQWPETLSCAHTVFIPKNGRKGIQEVAKLRPISISCLAYRAWAWVTLQKLVPHMDDILHPQQFGGIPKRCCSDMYLQMQLELERILVGHVPDVGEPPLRPHGFTEDSWKFFDTLQPQRIAQLMLNAGMHRSDVCLWLAFYRDHTRLFRIGKAIDSVFIAPQRGVLQGCPLSLFASNLLLKEWSNSIEATGAKPMSYVDDREVEASTPAMLQAAVEATQKFNFDEGLTTVIDADKTFCWHAKPPTQKIFWGSQPMPCQTQWSLLGTDVSATAQRLHHKSHERRRAFLNVVRRLACLPLSSFDRQLPHSASAIGKLIYGQEAQSMCDRESKSLRTAVLANLWENKHRRCPEAAIAICFQGHRHDPEMALVYNSFATIRRFVQHPLARQQWLTTWRAVCFSGRSVGQGPVLEFRRRLHKLGWQALSGLRFLTSSPFGNVEIDLLETDKSQFLHVLRDSLRRMLIRRAAARRPDFESAELADYDVTRAVLTNRQFFKWSTLRKSLHTLLSGAMVTQRVRMAQGKVDTAECPFCKTGDEDVAHVLWQCAAWQHLRDGLNQFSLNPDRWPAAMQVCGYFIPSALNAPRPELWSHIQIVLAQIIQARTQFLTDHDLFDPKPLPTLSSHDQPETDFGSINKPVPRSQKFPLFRPFQPKPDAVSSLSLVFQKHTPLFNTGSTGAWNWGKDVWVALQHYWSRVQITWPSAETDIECTPWIVVALDAALLCGSKVFARADGNTDLLCLLQTFKRASRRYGHLSQQPCFNQDGPDSKRLRPLWIPQVDTLQFCVHLLKPHCVNSLLEQWGEFCLKCELDHPDSAPTWSAKAAWNPWKDSMAHCQPFRRLRSKQPAPDAPVPAFGGAPPCKSASAPSSNEPPELSYGEKQSALQAKRRFEKLRVHNQRAAHSPVHVIRASQLWERPTCVTCGVERRKGHWLRLAQSSCPKHDVAACQAAIQHEDILIQNKLAELETILAQKTVRPDVTANFQRKRQDKAQTESEMSLSEALALPYKRKLRVIKLLGFSSVKEAQAACDQD